MNKIAKVYANKKQDALYVYSDKCRPINKDDPEKIQRLARDGVIPEIYPKLDVCSFAAVANMMTYDYEFRGYQVIWSENAKSALEQGMRELDESIAKRSAELRPSILEHRHIQCYRRWISDAVVKEKRRQKPEVANSHIPSDHPIRSAGRFHIFQQRKLIETMTP